LLIHPRVRALFDYQLDLVEQILGLSSRSSKGRRALVSLPTGGGKTRVGIWAMLEMIAHRNARSILWVAPSVELLQQAEDALRDMWKVFPAADRIDIRRAVLMNELGAEEAPVVFFLTPQLLRSRQHKLQREMGWPDLLVFDEAHQASARTYRESIEKVVRDSHGKAVIVGLSATPGRANTNEAAELTATFGNKLITSDLLGRRPVDELRNRGVLSQIEFRQMEIEEGATPIVVGKKNLGRARLDWLSTNNDRFRASIDTIIGLPKTERAIVFAASIAHANAILCVIQSRGVTCDIITSMTDPARRRSAIDSFARGDCQVLVNKNILATGYDCPATSHIVLTSPIGSPILFEQAVGRVSRGPLVGGNEKGTVWQLDDHVAIHGVPASYYRFRDIDWN
jgi:superfamily II DNA or RNA helicase